jgi:hypothetical protein
MGSEAGGIGSEDSGMVSDDAGNGVMIAVM